MTTNSKDYLRKVGNRIRTARKAKGISMKELGSRVGVSESAICRYERGNMSMAFNIVKKISDVLDVSTNYILCYDDDTTFRKERFLTRWKKEINTFDFTDSEMADICDYVNFVIAKRKRGEK